MTQDDTYRRFVRSCFLHGILREGRMKTVIHYAPIVAVMIMGLLMPQFSHGAEPNLPQGVKTQEFLFEHAPFPSCHASTICQTPTGLIAAYFAGAKEGAPDVGIWVSLQDKSQWGEPVEVAIGVEAEGKRVPCWNPVLFQPEKGPLLLFYKVGPKPSKWWG